MPHCIITGTVINEVPPVTTLMTAVTKKIMANKETAKAAYIAA